MGQYTTEEARPVTGTAVAGAAYGAESNVQQGVPISGQRVVVVEEAGREDYLPACLSSALCGPFGILATLLCCPTQYGKFGAASGCAWNTMWRVSLLLAAVILVSLNVIDCDRSLTPDEISKSDCLDHNGNFTNGACYEWCPSGYKMMHTERDNFTQWCQDPDPTCTGLSRTMVIINVAVSFVFLVFAIYGMRYYSRKIEESPEYVTVV